MKKTHILFIVLGIFVGIVLSLFVLPRVAGKNDARDTMNSAMPVVSEHTPAMNMDSEMASMVHSLDSYTGNAFDQEFLKEMIVHHQGAVDMAQIVLKKSQNKDLIAFAQSIITNQSREIEQMKQWQSALGATR